MREVVKVVEEKVIWPCVISGDDRDESRARGFTHGARPGRSKLRLDAADVAGLPARGPALRGRPVHGQFRPLRPVPGIPAAAWLPGPSRYLHDSITLSSS